MEKMTEGLRARAAAPRRRTRHAVPLYRQLQLPFQLGEAGDAAPGLFIAPSPSSAVRCSAMPESAMTSASGNGFSRTSSLFLPHLASAIYRQAYECTTASSSLPGLNFTSSEDFCSFAGPFPNQRSAPQSDFSAEVFLSPVPITACSKPNTRTHEPPWPFLPSLASAPSR